MWIAVLIALLFGVAYLDLRPEIKRERKKARRRDRRKGYLPNPWYIEFLLRFKKANRSEDPVTGYFLEYKRMFGSVWIINEGFAPRRKDK